MEKTTLDFFRCEYCAADIPAEQDTVPAVNDDAGWAVEAWYHTSDCEWVVTRAHRMEVTS